MREDVAKALLVFGLSATLFLLLKPHIFIKDETEKPLPEEYPLPVVSEAELNKNAKGKDALKGLTTWIRAYNDGQDDAFMYDLNKEIITQYGVCIKQKKDGSLVAQDLDDNIILKV